eukprot:TRINITY_DN6022_c0_g1_i2.p1 TRINITY_DN6022_c0_g1~~TRINITY_DN6022_c0_g1_i2.p1  ORF type:complete len:115 (-),score=35.99 TRINITY_DN6022_c0_g1_i2:123-467(-)
MNKLNHSNRNKFTSNLSTNSRIKNDNTIYSSSKSKEKLKLKLIMTLTETTLVTHNNNNNNHNRFNDFDNFDNYEQVKDCILNKYNESFQTKIPKNRLSKPLVILPPIPEIIDTY